MLRLYGIWTAKKWNAMIKLVRADKEAIVLYLTPGTIVDFSGREEQ